MRGWQALRAAYASFLLCNSKEGRKGGKGPISAEQVTARGGLDDDFLVSVRQKEEEKTERGVILKLASVLRPC